MHYRNIWNEVPEPKVENTPSRFGRALGKYTVRVLDSCTDCLKCVAVCPQGVFQTKGNRLAPPLDHLCLGRECAAKANRCVKNCPVNAIRVGLNPSSKALGGFSLDP